MNIPGVNLLSIAMRSIGQQTVRYYRNTGRTTSDTGRDVPEYAAPVDVTGGSVQAVDRSRYTFMGLDFSKDYVTWFVSLDVVGVDRDYSGDVIEFAGRKFQLQSETNWLAMDGWKSILCVRVGDAG